MGGVGARARLCCLCIGRQGGRGPWLSAPAAAAAATAAAGASAAAAAAAVVNAFLPLTVLLAGWLAACGCWLSTPTADRLSQVPTSNQNGVSILL